MTSEEVHPTSVAWNVLQHLATHRAETGGFADAFDGATGVETVGQSAEVTHYTVVPGQPVLASIGKKWAEVSMVGEYGHMDEMQNFFLQSVQSVDPEAAWDIKLPRGAGQATINIGGKAAYFVVENRDVPIGRTPGSSSPGTVLRMEITDDNFDPKWHRPLPAAPGRS